MKEGTKEMPKQIRMLDEMRLAMVRERCPARVINRISEIYLQELKRTETAERGTGRAKRWPGT